jgi:hypothetical protein
VESGVGHAKKTPLKGLRFESLNEAQTYLDHWEERWADTRIHGTTKRQVAAMFAEEKPALLPLPIEPFRYYQYGEAHGHLDGCVEVEAAYYSAPPGWIGRRVQVQWDHRYVRLLIRRPASCCGSICARCAAASHPRRGPPPANAAGHATPAVRADRAGRRSARCAAGCTGAGATTQCAAFKACCRWPRSTARRAVEDACAAALEVGICDYRFVRRYLERGPQLPLSLAPSRSAHPRTHAEYRDFIENKTKESKA